MNRPARLTAKRRENLARLTANAAIIIFAALVIGAFVGGPFRPRVFVMGLLLDLAAVMIIWWLEP